MRFRSVVLALIVLNGIPAPLPAHALEPSSQAQAAKKYFCPMHPQVTSDKPGDCPICHMRLVPVGALDAPARHAGDDRKVLFYRHPMRPEVTSQTPDKDEMGMDYIPVYAGEDPPIRPESRRLLGIRTEPAEVRPLRKTLEAWGQIAHDPELYQMQIEFLREGRLSYERERSRTPLAQLRSLTGQEKGEVQLLDRGLSPEWIEDLLKAGVPDKRLILHHEASGAWAYVQVPEQDAALVKKGDKVLMRAASVPGTEIEGRIEYLDGMIDEESRTLRVRVLIENAPAAIRPAMTLSASIPVELGPALTVPEEAVLFTGKKAVVYVEKDGVFTPRQIVTGSKAQGYYEVREGLSAGEAVAVDGNFFIDSDSRLKASFASEPGAAS